tara:strand:+ start:221 stop:634 length:414 start_codon:yes stop_codon:yes gene_type:complete
VKSSAKHSKLTTKRRGLIGELFVEIDLLQRDLNVFRPQCDDRGIDYCVLLNNKTYTIQVKFHTSKTTQTAMAIKMKPTTADIIAVPFVNGGYHQVFYIWNKRKKDIWNINISISRPKNNQTKGIHFGKDYKEFPPND